MKQPTILQAVVVGLVSAFLTGSGFAQDAKGKDPGSKPFNGRDLKLWDTKEKKGGADKWVVGTPSLKDENQKTFDVQKVEEGGAMINSVDGHGQSWDIFSKETFGDCRIDLEVMVPKGANSGIYVMGEYEVQVLDSYGKEKVGNGDMGAIYGAGAPRVNASKKPGEWQKYVILWRAPKFDDAGNKTGNAKFIRVRLNGKIIQQNVEMEGPTPGGLTGREGPKGPIMFQGDHGPVAFRNIKISPLRPRATKKK
jgi:hypothetical protein